MACSRITGEVEEASVERENGGSGECPSTTTERAELSN